MDDLAIRRLLVALKHAHVLNNPAEAIRLLRECRKLLESDVSLPDANLIDGKGDGTTFVFWLCRAASPHLKHKCDKHWLELLDLRRDSILDALENALPIDRLQIINDIWRFWLARGDFEEGLNCVLGALDGNDDAPRELVAGALHAAGVLSSRLGRYDKALAFLDSARDEFLSLLDLNGIAATFNALGTLFSNVGQNVLAQFYQCLSALFYGLIEDEWGLATAWNCLGIAAWNLGELTVAETLFRLSAETFAKIGDDDYASSSLTNLANIAYRLQDYSTAVVAYKQALHLFVKTGNRAAQAIVLHNLGDTQVMAGEFAEASDYLRRSLFLRRTIQYYPGISQTFDSLARIASERADYGYAARLIGVSASLREIYPLELSPEGAEALSLLEGRVKDMLPQSYASEWALGYELSLEDAISYAAEGGIA